MDQSHCNYQLSSTLEAAGWQVIFRDPGRATRGASGLQAATLGVFERSGLPLPDIAATMGTTLLLIEVDKSARDNAQSFQTYRDQTQLIIREINSAIPSSTCDRLLIGFCKIGKERRWQKLLDDYDLDVVVEFTGPLSPEFHWAAAV